jgi:hypothetical protein
MENEPNRSTRIRRTPEQIRKILDDYQTSGQTMRQFAQEHGVGLSTLGSWRRRYQRRKKSSAHLVEVPNPLSHGQPTGRFRFANGLVLELENGFEVPAMAQLVQLLQHS